MYFVLLLAFFSVGARIGESFVTNLKDNSTICANNTLCGTIVDMYLPIAALAVLFTPVVYLMVSRGQ